MLENCNTARERWGGVSDIIDRWLKDRQELIIQFSELSRGEDRAEPVRLRQRLANFCEILVDYVSAGHFEVYEQLIQEAREFDDGGVELARRVYPRIEAITEVALEFNDRFDALSASADADLGVLLNSLAASGALLEERFELEDALIEALHNAHADQLA